MNPYGARQLGHAWSDERWTFWFKYMHSLEFARLTRGPCQDDECSSFRVNIASTSKWRPNCYLPCHSEPWEGKTNQIPYQLLLQPIENTRTMEFMATGDFRLALKRFQRLISIIKIWFLKIKIARGSSLLSVTNHSCKSCTFPSLSSLSSVSGLPCR